MNFVSFAVIAQIDDFYAQSLKNSFLQQLIRLTSLNYQSDHGFKAISLNNKWYSKLTFCLLYKPLKVLYDCFYFYFAPTLALFISFSRQYTSNKVMNWICMFYILKFKHNKLVKSLFKLSLTREPKILKLRVH